MKRRLLNVLTGMSLLLSGASASAWLFSLPLGERERTWFITTDVRVTLLQHGMSFHTTRQRLAGPPIATRGALQEIEWRNFPGDIYYFRWPTHSEWSVTLPLAVPLVFGMVLPAFHVMAVSRAGKRRGVQCAGYCRPL